MTPPTGPFAPRFEIGKLEVSDAEATEEIKEGFVEAGLYPGMYTNLNNSVKQSYNFNVQNQWRFLPWPATIQACVKLFPNIHIIVIVFP